MLVEVNLIGFSRVSFFCYLPVDGVDFIPCLLSVGLVGVFLQVGFYCLFRTAHQGIGPVVVYGFEGVEMRHDGVDMSLVGILVGVEIALKNVRIVALHGVFVGFFFLLLVGVVVEIKECATNDECKDERANPDGAVGLLLLFVLVVNW